MENYLSIGKIASTHGVKGEIIMEHHLGEDADLKGVEAIFIEDLGGKLLPYFISSFKNRQHNALLIALEGIDTPEKAKTFLKKKVWLKEEDVKKKASTAAPISLLGFDVIEKKKILGKVLEVIEQPVQILVRIEMQGNEVFIPLNESTLERVDHRTQKIWVTLPQGLLDIYLT